MSEGEQDSNMTGSEKDFYRDPLIAMAFFAVLFFIILGDYISECSMLSLPLHTCIIFIDDILTLSSQLSCSLQW